MRFRPPGFLIIIHGGDLCMEIEGGREREEVGAGKSSTMLNDRGEGGRELDACGLPTVG